MKMFLFILAMLVEFAGCALIFIDALVTKKTDQCQDPVPGEFLRYRSNKESGFFVLAVPEFAYEYKGKSYEGPSGNQFWKLYLAPGKMIVPFLEGKTYGVYVDPLNPTRYITAGEQRFTVMHVISVSVVLIGAAFLWFVTGLPEDFSISFL